MNVMSQNTMNTSAMHLDTFQNCHKKHCYCNYVSHYIFFIKVHSNALTNTELLSMLNNQNKSQEHQFDLIITSPMFNELGVMLGKVFAVVI